MTFDTQYDLQSEADLAAQGDEVALDRIFAALGGPAWGVGFSAADAVGPASNAVSRGFAEVLQLFDNGIPVNDLRFEVMRSTRDAALTNNDEDAEEPTPEEEEAQLREPLSLLGETKDRQATLAFTALPETMRTSLWLAEAEQWPEPKIANLIGKSTVETELLVSKARALFRKHYVGAVRRVDLPEECGEILDLLPAYVDRSLPAGDIASVEHHLADCKECRSVVMKLDDLESRLHAAIPPLPAWTRQQVADRCAEFGPVVTPAGPVNREPADIEQETRSMRGLVGIIGVPAVVALLLLAFQGAGSNNDEQVTQFASSSNSSVSTPDVPREPAPTTTTVAPVTTTTAEIPVTTTTSPAPPAATYSPTTATPTPRPTTTSISPPTTAAPTTTTTRPPNVLVPLPPTPIG